jgi:hypothetical protein
VESLIIPIILLVLLGLWGVFENGRKFRREFLKRGKTWDAVCADMDRGRGVLIVDSIWGPQRGLGHPVIWWVPALNPGEDLGAKIETAEGGALLVRCPRGLKSMGALRGKFGAARVLPHTWAVGTTGAHS